MIKKLHFNLFIVVLIFFSSCTKDKLELKVKTSLRSDNDITQSELKSIYETILSDPSNYSEYIIKDDSVNYDSLKNYILTLARKRREQNDPQIFNPVEKQADNIKPLVTFYIENSISMDGYVKGNTTFEDDLGQMLVDTKYYVGDTMININFINKEVIPSSTDELEKFAKKLEPNSITYAVGGENRKQSDINTIFDEVLTKLNENGISILVSDCIYSLGKDKDTEGSLNTQKLLTKDAFNDALKKADLATVCLKMKSPFNGFYFDFNDSKTSLEAFRPYYIWIIGNQKLIANYYPKITKNLEGVQNIYYLQNLSLKEQPYYTVLRETNRIGNFKRGDKKEKDIRSLEDVEFKDNNLQFAIAVDLKEVLADSSYILNKGNYIVSDGFKIESITPITSNNLAKNDFIGGNSNASKASHFITISTSNKHLLKSLKLELKNVIPQWVNETNSLDDRDIKNQLNKTFGFSFLVAGITGAYEIKNPNQTSYFIITIDIKE